jgi:thiol-disulfide isomerase/thioredoxin
LSYGAVEDGIMKIRFQLAAVLAGTIAASTQLPAQVTPPPSQVLVDAAVRRAAAEHKAVLVTFGASWCGWCRRFSAFLADPGVGPIMAAHFVTVDLVTQEVPAKQALENPGSQALMAAMGGAGSGLPFFFVLDSTGKKTGDSNIMPGGGNVGHPDLPEEVAAFDQFLIRTAPRMTPAERTRIRAYLDRIAGRAGSVQTS